MAKLGINTGSTPNDGTGDTLLAAALKINQNFTEIYTTLGDGSNLSGVVTSLVGYATEGYVDNAIVGIVTSGALSGYATEGYVDNAVVGYATEGYVDNAILGIGSGTSSQWVSTAAGIHTLSNVGIGTTNATSALTVGGNTSLETLNVSGVSTFSGNISVAGTVTADTMVFTNDGGSSLNGSLTINNVSASYTELFFRDSSGSVQSNIQGGTNLSLNPGGSGYISLGTYSYFYPNGDVALNNGNQGTTLIRNQVHVQSGITSFYNNVSVGGTISVDGGVTLATNNPTIVGTSGTVGEIKRIGGAPFFYDGSAWREFVLSSGTPVSVPADTEWDSVVFRATFDDDYTDAKFGATPVYVSAGSTIVGAAVTIGTGAYRNDGSIGAGISYAYRSEYDFTGSWTIEFWMYVDSGPVYNNPTSPVSLVSMHSTTGIGTSGNWTLSMWSDQFANVYITWFNQNGVYVGGTTLYNTSGATWNNTIADKWNHFALVRESVNGSLHFYVNGQEESYTAGNTTIDNDILNISTNGLNVGGATTFTIGNITFNSNQSADVIIDDMRISCGVGTAGQRYTSVGIWTSPTFTPPTTALPTTGTLSSYIQPPGDKYGEITLGGSPTWRGTSGVTVSRQASGNYRVSFANTYTNSNDYYVLSQGMDQGFASYVGIGRSTTHVDISINRIDNDGTIDNGSLSVQIKNHI